MAPRGRKKMVGLRREDAARDAMIDYGFAERIINETIKELVQLYGDDGWKLIEDGGYDALLTRCLEKQEEQARQVAEEQKQEEEELEQHDLVPQEQEQEQHVETDTLSTTSEAVLDTSPAALQLGEASADYAHHSFGGGAGWLSCEEDSDPDEDGNGGDDDADDDDEMIQLTPEPLCEELEELLKEVRGQKKRKRL